MSDFVFSGLKVVDCATVIAAPAAAMMLADFGADVIKIETPGEGDMLRMLSMFVPDGAENWFWDLDGRNKRGIVLDFKNPDALEVLHKLAAECDVFITNHPYSIREKFGLTYEALNPLNPKMIYASLTAYGEEGEEKKRKGFDQLAYWGRSGLMDLIRQPGTRPTQCLPGMGDHPTGVALYASIVTALLQRERTGKGAKVHTSLLANGLWSAAGMAQGIMAGGSMTEHRERARVSPAMMRPYQTSDDRWLQFNMIRDEALFTRLVIALGIPELLSDERFADFELHFEHREALGDIIQDIVKTKTTADWMAIFESHELPINLAALVEDTPKDPQILLNKMAVVPEDSGIKSPLVINHPLKVSSAPQVGPKRGPELGEHADEILRELGYADDDIARLREEGALG
ncbi:MAG: CaiB/BaiF CoA-transferase family protein [Pseudomonadota bacterium]